MSIATWAPAVNGEDRDAEPAARLMLDAGRGVAYGRARMHRRLLSLAAAALVACGVAYAPPTPPTGLTTLAIALVVNHTGTDLVIAGDTIVERWMGRERRTVGDAIARELQSAVSDRGFTVATVGAVPRLTVTLGRFEPDLPQLSHVVVTLTATLTDADGSVRWTTERANWLVSTSGSPSLGSAYDTAARVVARGLVDGWQPAY